MKPRRPALALLAALAVSIPSLAAAQEPTGAFDQLDTRLKPGDTIWVTDAQGREIKGTLRDLSPAFLRLDAEGATQEFQAARVGTVQIQPKDSLKNGALLGAVVGCVLGALSCGANPECAGDESGGGVAAALGILGAGAGAGIGAWIDSAMKPPRLTVYRATGAAGHSRLLVAPVVGPRARGVAVSIAF